MATPTFFKNQIFTNKKRVLPIEWGRTWKIRVHNCTKDWSLRTSSQDILYYDRYMFDDLCKGHYKLYIRGYLPLFPNLITKESYNWWVTRRFWGFRQQISKEKYLKISQNVGCKYLEASGEHRGTVQKNILKCRSVSGWVLSEDPDMSDRGSWNALLFHLASDVECEISRWNVLDVRHSDGMAAEQNSGCETSGWKWWRAPLSGLP